MRETEHHHRSAAVSRETRYPERDGSRGREGNRGPFTIAKWGLILFLLIYIGLILRDQTTKDVDLSQIRQALQAGAEGAGLSEGDLNAFRKRFGFNPEGMEWLYFASGTLMNVQEALVMKSEDPDALSAAEAAVNARIDSQKEAFAGYGTNQTDLLEHAVVLQKGDYLFYAVSEDVEAWESAFLSCIR